MNVLVYFSGKLHEPKGTPIRTRNVIKQLARNGHNVYYAGHDTPEGFDAAHTLMLAEGLGRISQLVRFVRENKIDVVYIQTSSGIGLAPFLRLRTNARIGVDFHSRRYQEEHVYQNRLAFVTWCLEQFELFLCRFLHFGTAVSGKLKEYYEKSVPKFLVLPVGVDTTLFSPDIVPDTSITEWKGNSILIGYAGNLKWYQGVGQLLEAFVKLNETHQGQFKFLVIASSNTDEIRKYVEEHKLDASVRILDKQPHEAIPGLLSATDVLSVVRPSDLITEYAFPSKVSEYAALGKALIVGRVGDIETYIKDGENGIVVPSEDKQALVDALVRLTDLTLRTQMGKASRALALSEFDLAVLGKKLSDFLVLLSHA